MCHATAWVAGAGIYKGATTRGAISTRYEGRAVEGLTQILSPMHAVADAQHLCRLSAYKQPLCKSSKSIIIIKLSPVGKSPKSIEPDGERCDAA